MNRRILLRFLLVSVLCLVLAGPAATAPYGPDNKDTIFDRLYESDLVISGKISSMEKSGDGGVTEFQVYKNIKGGRWKEGDYFYVNSLLKHPENQEGVLYLYRSIRDGKEVYEFNAFYPDQNDEIYDYTMKVKEFVENGDDEGRLSWLFSNVSHTNDFIAWDSFAQLGMAPYDTLKKVAPDMNRESLRYLLGLGSVRDNRKSFYAFLLGLAGDPMDAALIRRIISNPAHRKSQTVYGAMMAYGLLLNDHPTFFYNNMLEGPDNVRMAILEAIENLIKYEKNYNPAPLSKPFYWAMKNGSREVVKKSVEVAAQTRITTPVKYMRTLYFNDFKDYPEGKIAVINYLKFVRKLSPDAPRVLEVIKARETDPKIKERI